MRILGRYIVVITVVLFSTTVYAQNAEVDKLGTLSSCVRTSECATTGSFNILVHYENDKAWPRWSYANNRAAYAELVDVIGKITSKRGAKYKIIIEGAASPVGHEKYNHRLALRRATILRNIIYKMPGGVGLSISVMSTGEDWGTLLNYVERHYHEPNRSQVLTILGLNLSNEEKKRHLQILDNGKTWRLLVDKFMDSARNATVIHIVEIDDLAPKTPPFRFKPVELLIDSDMRPKWSPTLVEEEVEPLRKPVVAIRSNLLVPALNIGVEVPIGNHWSVAADYYYPWIWPKEDNKNCFEMLAWGVEGRYWFGKERSVYDRLQGHSVGVYGYMGYYDFERNYHGSQGEFVNVGVDYTYAMAVGKRKGLHLEFSLGIGYIYSQARKYTVIESHGPLISDKITKKIHFFGPTKANVSLVVPIFQKVKPNDRRRGDE